MDGSAGSVRDSLQFRLRYRLGLLILGGACIASALRIVESEAHPIESSVMAFRRGGKDAGHKLVAALGLQG
jgi:hypothetical protein